MSTEKVYTITQKTPSNVQAVPCCYPKGKEYWYLDKGSHLNKMPISEYLAIAQDQAKSKSLDIKTLKFHAGTGKGSSTLVMTYRLNGDTSMQDEINWWLDHPCASVNGKPNSDKEVRYIITDVREASAKKVETFKEKLEITNLVNHMEKETIDDVYYILGLRPGDKSKEELVLDLTEGGILFAPAELGRTSNLDIFKRTFMEKANTNKGLIISYNKALAYNILTTDGKGTTPGKYFKGDFVGNDESDAIRYFKTNEQKLKNLDAEIEAYEDKKGISPDKDIVPPGAHASKAEQRTALVNKINDAVSKGIVNLGKKKILTLSNEELNKLDTYLTTDRPKMIEELSVLVKSESNPDGIIEIQKPLEQLAQDELKKLYDENAK